jgi:tetratricopeptide (TPR) repeat protein
MALYGFRGALTSLAVGVGQILFALTVGMWLDVVGYAKRIREWWLTPTVENAPSTMGEAGRQAGEALTLVGRGLYWLVLLPIIVLIGPFVIGKLLFGFAVWSAGTTGLWLLQLRPAGKVRVALILQVAAGTLTWGWFRFVERREMEEDALVDILLQGKNLRQAESELEGHAARREASERIAARLMALRTGVGDPDDVVMLRALMMDHFDQSRIDLALVEARKLAAANPRNYAARAVLASNAVVMKLYAERERKAALAAGNSAAAADAGRRAADYDALARRWLSSLPQMEDPATCDIHPGSLLMAAAAASDMGDRQRVRGILRFLIPLISSLRDTPLRLLAGESVLLVDLYARVLPASDYDPDFVALWKGVIEAADNVPDLPETALPQLLRLGVLLEHQLTAILPEFGRRRRVDSADLRLMIGTVERMLENVWDISLRKSGANVTATLGRAAQRHRQGKPEAAEAVVTAALAVCRPEDRPMLLAAKARLLRLRDPKASLDFAEQALRDSPESVQLLNLMVEAAVATGKLERAIEICRMARERGQGRGWSDLVEANLLTQLRRPGEAAERYAAMGSDLETNESAVHLYVQALCDANKAPEAVRYVNGLLDRRRPEVVVVAGLVGLCNVRQATQAVDGVERLLARYPNSPATRLACGYVYGMVAEPPDRADNDLDAARKALTHYEWLRERNPENPVVLNAMAWLRLNVLGDPLGAEQVSVPLRRRLTRGDVPPPCLDTLAAIDIAHGRFAFARQLLDTAVSADRSVSQYHAHLAEAYLGLNQREDARRSLVIAENLAKTVREKAVAAAIRKRLPLASR